MIDRDGKKKAREQQERLGGERSDCLNVGWGTGRGINVGGGGCVGLGCQGANGRDRRMEDSIDEGLKKNEKNLKTQFSGYRK